ncbi:MAG: anhydro-N-acetylmuramic acid kinase [Acetobacteraceae bacterium]
MWRVIGLMSGTSLDGVDAAWIETDGRTIHRFGSRVTLPYGDTLQRALRALIGRAPLLAADDPEVIRLTAALTARHRDAVAAIAEPADLIGMHGQTILHRPDQARTWQIGDAAWLADVTNLPVVHDFRAADVEAGGQGAPLAPIFHAALAADFPPPLAVLNIGGVANVTWIGPPAIGPPAIGPPGIGPPGTDRERRLAAMDTGPGNGPLDDWVRRRTGQAFDAEGRLAGSGRPNESVLERLMADPWFARPGPKSLDRLAFSATLAASGLDDLSAADGAATLAAFTARAVAIAPLPAPPRRWLVAGGGRHNPAIMAALRAAITAPLAPVETVGWDGDALEAQCFGFLAARAQAGLPLSFPETTGVRAPLCGGRTVRPRV